MEENVTINIDNVENKPIEEADPDLNFALTVNGERMTTGQIIRMCIPAPDPIFSQILGGIKEANTQNASNFVAALKAFRVNQDPVAVLNHPGILQRSLFQMFLMVFALGLKMGRDIYGPGGPMEDMTMVNEGDSHIEPEDPLAPEIGGESGGA